MINKTVRTAVAAVVVALGAASASASYAQSPSEEQTSRSVLAEFNHDVALRSDALHVQTIDGTVYISGQVDNALESQAAVDLASRVPSVAKVVDQTVVSAN